MTVRIAWERHGAGPPLILVQGIGLARWGLGPSVDLLAERFEVHRLRQPRDRRE